MSEKSRYILAIPEEPVVSLHKESRSRPAGSSSSDAVCREAEVSVSLPKRMAMRDYLFFLACNPGINLTSIKLTFINYGGLDRLKLLAFLLYICK